MNINIDTDVNESRFDDLAQYYEITTPELLDELIGVPIILNHYMDNINDLLEQLRSKNVADIADVEYAILETSGQLSVILKSEKRPVKPEDMDLPVKYDGLPITLVIDGQVINENIKKMNYNEEWLQQKLKQRKHRQRPPRRPQPKKQHRQKKPLLKK